MLSSLRLAAVAALATFSSVQALPQSTDGGDSNNNSSTPCNNSPELCSRQYNRITHLGPHNSAFLRDESTGDSVSGNQYKNATIALDAGLRLLQAQVHWENNSLRLCHSSCDLLDAGLLQDWLAKINSWMEDNTNEVVTILLVNSDSRPAADVGAAFNGSGISQFGYTPSGSAPTSEWPTLQSMIDANTRLVSFVTNTQTSTEYPFLLPEFSYVFETPFEVTTIDGFNCTLDRPSEAGSTSSAAVANGYLSLVNHFKYQPVFGDIMVPDVDTLSVVNNAGTGADGNIGRHLQECQSEWPEVPTFALVDFWSDGNALSAVDSLNGVSNAEGRSDSSPKVEGAAGGNTGIRRLGHGALLAAVAGVLLMV